MILGLLGLLVCQLVGEVVVALTDAPVPGPVIGLVLLFAYLQVRRAGDDAAVVRTSQAVLTHLQLLFIPPGVGVMVYVSVVRTDALPIGVAVVVSWFLGLTVVAWGTVLLSRVRLRRRRGGTAPEAS